MMNKVKQKQICRRTCYKKKKKIQVKHCSHVSSGRTTSTSPVDTPVKFHSSQRNVALLTPLVRKSVTLKDSDYSSKLRGRESSLKSLLH